MTKAQKRWAGALCSQRTQEESGTTPSLLASPGAGGKHGGSGLALPKEGEALGRGQDQQRLACPMEEPLGSQEVGAVPHCQEQDPSERAVQARRKEQEAGRVATVRTPRGSELPASLEGSIGTEAPS